MSIRDRWIDAMDKYVERLESRRKQDAEEIGHLESRRSEDAERIRKFKLAAIQYETPETPAAPGGGEVEVFIMSPKNMKQLRDFADSLDRKDALDREDAGIPF